MTNKCVQGACRRQETVRNRSAAFPGDGVHAPNEPRGHYQHPDHGTGEQTRGRPVMLGIETISGSSRGHDKTGQGRTRREKTGQGKERQGRAGQGRAEQDRTGQIRAGQDRTGQLAFPAHRIQLLAWNAVSLGIPSFLESLLCVS